MIEVDLSPYSELLKCPKQSQCFGNNNILLSFKLLHYNNDLIKKSEKYMFSLSIAR